MDSPPLFQRSKPKVFISYDHQEDGEYYDLCQRLFSSVAYLSRDNSLERELDTGDPETFVRHLCETALADTNCTVVLCGARTHLDKFVDWEIKAALDRRAGLIAVILPSNPRPDSLEPLLPERMKDNFDGGYGVVCRWRELVDGKIDLTQRISFATGRLISTIINSRPLRAGGN